MPREIFGPVLHIATFKATGIDASAIRAQTATFITDQLYANVDVEAEIRSFLPTQYKQLAGPAAGGVRNLVGQAADKALQTPAMQNAWADANQAAHRALVKLDEGSYGRCDVCGAAIPDGRIEVHPSAIRCVACAQP